MKHEKQLKRVLRRIQTPDMETVLPNSARTEAHAPLRPRKKWLTAPVLALFAVILIGCAAVPVIIGQINTGWITEQSGRLTEVPEGYTAIYTAEDLVQMSRDIADGSCAEYYILMNDITFTPADFTEGGICEGGWDPVDLTAIKYYHFDDKDNIPEGYEYGKSNGAPYVRAIRRSKLKVFNGNGHVIRGLDIRADAAEKIAAHTDYGYSCRDIYVGLFGSSYSYTPVHVINLGMEDCSITVTGADIHAKSMLTVHVGAIAGEIYYAGACYADNVSIRVELSGGEDEACGRCVKKLDHDACELAIGPLVGSATYLDACYAEHTAVDVVCRGPIPFYPHIGGLAGMSQSTLTSWHSGTVSIAGNAIIAACEQPREHFDPWAYGDRVPIAVTKENFEILNAKAIATYGEDTYEHKLLKAYYLLKDPTTLKSARQIEELNTVMKIWSKMIAHHTGNYETEYDAYYLFDPYATSEDEIARMEAHIGAVFASDEEYRAFCDECNVKIGDIYCYEITDGTKVRQKDLEGFDFETVWVMQNGRPRLRIFAE